MPKAELPCSRLTDYERAVCYFTLPRIDSPVNNALLVAYAVCVCEAAGALVIGLTLNHRVWTLAGAISLWAIIFFGAIVFTGRALLSEVRQRRALAQARGVPDAKEEAQDLPDPFAGHLLLLCPGDSQGKLFCCTEKDATIRYFVDNDARAGSWRINSAQDVEVCRVVRGRRPWWHWAVGSRRFRWLSVTAEDREVATITPVLNLYGPVTRIRCTLPNPPRDYFIRQHGVYCEGRLVGRMYSLHGAHYLDLQEEHMNDGILAYFVSRI